MKLFKHQQKILDDNPSKHLLAWQTGTGKTIAGIELANKNGDGDTLIICPKSLKEQWKENIPQHGKRYMNWDVLTKEEFKKQAKDLRKFDTIIIDEAHYFSGMKSQMAKSLMKYIKKHDPKYIYLLTATPYLSTPFNIYTLARILGKKWSYPLFKSEFFVDIRMGGRVIPVVKKNIEDKIAGLVNRLGSTVKMEDCVDVPEQTFLTEYFDLTSEQKKLMKQVDEEDFLPIVKFTKYHQICGGTLKGEDEDDPTITCKSEKLNRLLDLCNEHKKVVVVCRYNKELDWIFTQLRKKKKTVFEISGRIKDRHEMIKKAEESDDCVLLVNAACSEGYQLPSFPIMIFYSYDFSLKNYIQMIGRIQRIDAIKKNVYISLITKKSIDEEVYKCIQNKKDFDVAIYNQN